MKGILRRIAGFLARHIEERLQDALPGKKELAQMQATQATLRLNARLLYEKTGSVLNLREAEFSCFSQNFEDGNLFYLFSLIGETNRTSIEICAGDGIESNSANLILNHGWRALLIDGSAEQVERGKKFFAASPASTLQPPVFASHWITRDNINETIGRYGFEGEIDLFVLDIDGNDYYVWEALSQVNPRVVMLEFNSVWPAKARKVIPYAEDFVFEANPGYWLHYCGASLGAFQALAQKKGYRLVGIESKYGYNAYFMRNDVGADIFPEIDPEEALKNIPHRMAYTPAFRDNPDPEFQAELKRVQSMPWLDV
ncbi:MAG: hypothetical protein RIF32_01640 [Leptospirales bacterium]|jgi:hypothetical protein